MSAQPYKYLLALLLTAVIISSTFFVNNNTTLAIESNISSQKAYYILGDTIKLTGSIQFDLGEQKNLTNVLLDISGPQPLKNLSIPISTCGTNFPCSLSLESGRLLVTINKTGGLQQFDSSYAGYNFKRTGSDPGILTLDINWKLLVAQEPVGSYTATLTAVYTSGTSQSTGATFTVNPEPGVTPPPAAVTPVPPTPIPTPVPPPTERPAPDQVTPVTSSFAPVVTSTGVVLINVVIKSGDNFATINVLPNTTALNADKTPLTSIDVKAVTTPPAPGKNDKILGTVYDFGPDGATFNPPALLTLVYTAKELPIGFKPADLKVAFFSGGQWTTVPSLVNPLNQTVTGSIDHFTAFAIVAPGAALLPPTGDITPSSSLLIGLIIAGTALVTGAGYYLLRSSHRSRT